MPDRSRLAAAALVLFAPVLAAGQYEDPPEDPGPRGPHFALLLGRFDPTGPSLVDFPGGLAFAGRVGWRFGARLGLEADWRRSATSLQQEAGTVDVVQTSFTPALRIYGSMGPVRTEGSAGLGWFKLSTTGTATSGVEAEERGQSRMGFLLSGGAALPVTPGLELLLGATYGGAYSTLFDYNPVWIGGWALECGVRFTILAPAAAGEAARPPGS